jgi:hypothetical protein
MATGHDHEVDLQGLSGPIIAIAILVKVCLRHRNDLLGADSSVRPNFAELRETSMSKNY